MSDIPTPVRIHIITVIYNRQIEAIRSLPEFVKLQKRHHEVGLIIVDNSTAEVVLEHNRETASRMDNIRYIECGGNIGLSRAYNRALATIPQEQPFWVMLSDDDTWFSPEYLENGCREINVMMNREILLGRRLQRGGHGSSVNTGSDFEEKRNMRQPLHRDSQYSLQVLCGVVETKSGWMSPRTEYAKEMVFSSLLKRPKPGIYRDLYPINSGIFLEGDAIRKVGGFDERLFLDQVDFLMMDKLRARGIRRIGVLPGKILQSFSGEIGQAFSSESGQSFSGKTEVGSDLAGKVNGEAGESSVKSQSSQERWEIFRKDFETYCEITEKPWYYRSYILGRRRLMLGVQKLLSGRTA